MLIFLLVFKYMESWSNFFLIENLSENKKILIVNTSPKRFCWFSLFLNNENKNILKSEYFDLEMPLEFLTVEFLSNTSY